MIKCFPKHKTLLFISQNKYNHNNMGGYSKTIYKLHY
uniref:Uncharacterized protein n=1 Tax=Siphoviridae sp. ctEkS11 TaxID=2827272 RepID=A0A8S5R3P8_9CAUD|nr:MAG TPA: hypothetical protein [Siphoviridae sp. ctEkS11]